MVAGGFEMTRFIRLPEVLSRTGLKRSSVYAFIEAGTFPAQIPLGERAVGWDESEVSAWIDQRIAAARQKSVPGYQCLASKDRAA